MDELLGFLTEALNISSVTGNTKKFEKFLSKKFRSLGYKTKSSSGGLVVKSLKNDSGLCFCAHLDRVGFVKTKGHYEYSTAFFRVMGDKSWPQDASFLSKVQTRYEGESLESENSKLRILHSNIGKRKVEFFLNKRVLDKYISLSRKVNLKRGWYTGQLDNILSIGILFLLCKEQTFQGTILFSNNEEISGSDEFILANAKNAKNLIVLDTSTEVSLRDFKKGVVLINSKEIGTKFDEKLHKKVIRVAKSNKVPFKSNIDKSFTELSVVVKKTKNKINGITVRIPRTNYHKSTESTSLTCVKNYYKLIKLISTDLAS